MRSIPLFLSLLLTSVGCSQLGDPIDEGTSRNYYYGWFKNRVVFSYGGNCLGPGCTTIPQADVSTFRPLSPTYAIDQDHVFYEALTIPEEDPKNFRALGGGYAVGESKAYFQGRPFLADVASFQTFPLGPSSSTERYAKDQGAVYFRDVVVSHAPSAFRALSQSHYFLDDHKAYYLSGGINKVLSSDPAHLQFVKNPDGSDSVYVADSTRVFIFGRALPEADAKTFRVLCSDEGGQTIASDALHVFKFDHLLAGMSPSEFSGSCK